jgi:hypothetical protein
VARHGGTGRRQHGRRQVRSICPHAHNVAFAFRLQERFTRARTNERNGDDCQTRVQANQQWLSDVWSSVHGHATPPLRGERVANVKETLINSTSPILCACAHCRPCRGTGDVRSRRLNRKGSVYLGFNADSVDALSAGAQVGADNDGANDNNNDVVVVGDADDDVEDDIFDEEEDTPAVPMRGTPHNQMRAERSASGAYGFTEPGPERSSSGPHGFSRSSSASSDDVDFLEINPPQPHTKEPPMRPARRGLRRQGSVYEGFKGDAPKEAEGGVSLIC